MFSTCPFVRPSVRSFVRSSVTEHVNNVSKTAEPILLEIGTVILRTKACNDQIWESGGQRPRSQEAEVRFGGLAEASFSSPLGRVTYIYDLTLYCATQCTQERRLRPTAILSARPSILLAVSVTLAHYVETAK